MASLQTQLDASSRRDPSIRAIYRDSAGEIHLDWPASAIPVALEDRGGTLWVDVEDRDSNEAVVGSLLRDLFHFHPLAIEDALKETHIPKLDDWGPYLYLVFHSIDFDPDSDGLRLHELDVFLGDNYLLTYHSEPLTLIEQHRRNIERDPMHRMRHGADHVLYHLLDLGVAEYLPAIEHLDNAIDEAQDEVFLNPNPATLERIFRVKRSALRLNRILAPQREVLSRLSRDPFDQVATEHLMYFRDVYDHMVRVHDITESLRDLISSALDTYLSAISNRTNEVMKTLTLVTVFFLPMTFLVGFFGMNFFGESMEFRSPMPKGLMFWGAMVLMVLTPPALWQVVRRRKWF